MRKPISFCIRNMLFLLTLFPWHGIKAQPSGDPHAYANFMLNTVEGQALYNYYLNLPAEDNTYLSRHYNAVTAVTFHYVAEWHKIFDPPDSPDPGDDQTMCFNSDFGLNEQNDNRLDGFRLFDGHRRLIENCDVSTIEFCPLPEDAVPVNPIDPDFEFNLNPDGNGNVDDLSGTEHSGANYHSMELYVDEEDLNISDIFSATPPSGETAFRINNEHTKFHVNKLSRTFIVSQDQPVYYYNHALVMEDPFLNHSLEQKPFFKAQVTDENGSILLEKCVIASFTTPNLEYIDVSSSAGIVHRPWACDSFDLTPFIGSKVTIDFITADCGRGEHWGYSYIADICTACNDHPKIELFPASFPCTFFPIEFCGKLYVPDDYQFLNLSLSIYHEGNEVLLIGNPEYDPGTGLFCFTITSQMVAALSNGNYEVYAIATLINPKGQVVTIRSLSANPNVSDDEIETADFIKGIGALCIDVEIYHDCKVFNKYYVQLQYDPTVVTGIENVDFDNIRIKLGSSTNPSYPSEVIYHYPSSGVALLSFIATNPIPPCNFALRVIIPTFDGLEFTTVRSTCVEQCFQLGDFTPTLPECVDSSVPVEFCGAYVPAQTDEGTLDLVEINLAYSNSQTSQSGILNATFGLIGGELCIETDFGSLSGCFDLELTFHYEGQNGRIYSFTVADFISGADNDICLEPGGCCPDLNLNWMAAMDNIECVHNGNNGEKILTIDFVLYLPTGYSYCGAEPVFEDGYFDVDVIEYAPLQNAVHVKGDYHITDIPGFDVDFIIRGSLEVCEGGNPSILCPAVFEIARIDCHGSCASDPCGENECVGGAFVSEISGGTSYVTMWVNIPPPADGCSYDDYHIFIYDEDWTVIDGFEVNPRYIQPNGDYYVEIEDETLEEVLCFNVLVMNYCNNTEFCRAEFCIENEPAVGGTISGRTNQTNPEFRIWPNPTKGDEVVITSGSPDIRSVNVTLHDVHGMSLSDATRLDLFGGNGKLTLPKIVEGYYYLRIDHLTYRPGVTFLPLVIIK